VSQEGEWDIQVSFRVLHVSLSHQGPFALAFRGVARKRCTLHFRDRKREMGERPCAHKGTFDASNGRIVL
jgi:hypothetical protein